MDYYLNCGELLCRMLASLIKGESLEQTQELPENFYSFCRRHKVTNMVYPVIKEWQIPDEVKTRFKEDYSRVIAIEAMQEVFAGVLFSTFEQEKISFLPVKGILIKKLYPKEYYRSSNDVDILIKNEDFEKAKDVMEGLGYTANICDNQDNDYHIEFHKKKVSVELHKSLAPLNSTHFQYFRSSFDRAENVTDYHYEMNKEDFYIYTLYHLYKHFIKGGVGVRYFLDMYLINKKITFNREYIENELEKIGLKDFDKTVKELGEVFFEKKEMDSRLKALARYVYISGAHGETSFFTIAKFKGAGTNKNNYTLNKVRFYKEAWFIGREGMSVRYPVLIKHKWLLPFCYIHKGFYTVFKKPEAIKEQKESMTKHNKDLASYIDGINKMAGL